VTSQTSALTGTPGPAAELILMQPGRGLKQGELADPDALQLAWAALLRMLEKTAPGFRD